MAIAPFDPDAATPEDFEQYFQVELAAQQLDRPLGPTPTLQAVTGRLTSPHPADMAILDWVDRTPDGTITGTAFVIKVGKQNPHLAAMDIVVHPQHRRRGIGTALLAQIVASAAGRATLMIEGMPADGAGSRFADAHGFAVVQRTIRQRLELAGADRSRWQVPESPGYRLVRWTRGAPDDLLTSYAAARNAIASRPHGESSWIEQEWTARRVREEGAEALADHRDRRVVVAVHDQTGAVAGLTYLEIYQRRPEIAIQQDTAVLPAHRGNRLGLWMKAANVLWLADDHPDVTLVRTSTAADNDHMFRINERLGFTLELATEIREADIASLLARLGNPAPHPRARTVGG